MTDVPFHLLVIASGVMERNGTAIPLRCDAPAVMPH